MYPSSQGEICRVLFISIKEKVGMHLLNEAMIKGLFLPGDGEGIKVYINFGDTGDPTPDDGNGTPVNQTGQNEAFQVGLLPQSSDKPSTLRSLLSTIITLYKRTLTTHY